MVEQNNILGLSKIGHRHNPAALHADQRSSLILFAHTEPQRPFERLLAIYGIFINMFGRIKLLTASASKIKHIKAAMILSRSKRSRSCRATLTEYSNNHGPVSKMEISTRKLYFEEHFRNLQDEEDSLRARTVFFQETTEAKPKKGERIIHCMQID